MLTDLPTSAPSGAAVLVDMRAMDGLLDRLHNGDPTKGWEGDPALFLAFHRPDQRWELWRQDPTGPSLVGKSRPGLPFPANLVDELIRRDVRRGFDPYAATHARKDELDRLADYEHDEKMGPAAEKLAWALRKDLKGEI